MKRPQDKQTEQFTNAFIELLNAEEKDWQKLQEHQHIQEDGKIITHSHSHSHKQKGAVINRLARLTGHLNAVKKMVENDRDCSEVLMQLAAVDAAIKSVGKVIIKDHLRTCLVEAVHENDDEAIIKLSKSIEQFIK